MQVREVGREREKEKEGERERERKGERERESGGEIMKHQERKCVFSVCLCMRGRDGEIILTRMTS